MFEHADFDRYEYNEIPLDRDIYLVDEAYIHEYHQMMLEFFNNRAEYRHIGYVSPVAARHIGEHSVELTWYITHERWHEIRLTLPKSEIICCVVCMGARSPPACHHPYYISARIALTILTLWLVCPFCQCMTRAHLHITFAQRVQKPAQYWHNAAHKTMQHARTPTTQRSAYRHEYSNVRWLDVGAFLETFYVHFVSFFLS